jgi:hypothetical protein
MEGKAKVESEPRNRVIKHINLDKMWHQHIQDRNYEKLHIGY